MIKIRNRPLSPHLTIYISQFTSIYSIWHRITGLSLLLVLILFIVFCKFTSCLVILPEFIYYFLKINLWLQNCIFINFLVLITYHSINGLRHINWDLGFNLFLKPINITSKIIILFLTILLFLKLQSIIN